MYKISQILESAYSIVNDEKTKNYIKSEQLFLIIQIKINNDGYLNYWQSLYQDSKQFILYYTLSIDNRDYGYDILNTQKIIDCIYFHNNEHIKNRLAQYSTRILKNEGFEKENLILNNIVNRTKTKILNSKPYHIGKYTKLALHLSSYNVKTAITVLTVLFLINCIVLLPAPFKSWEVYSINYDNYSTNYILNHILNIFSHILGIGNGVSIHAKSVLGIICLISIKIIYIIFIVNYLFKMILEKLIENQND